MPDVGDRVRMDALKVDQAPREGVVTAVSGSLLHVKWSTGEETAMIPGPGSIVVIGQVKTSGKKASASGKATKKTAKATKRSTR